MTVESSFGSAPSPAYNRPDVTGLVGPTSSESTLKAFDDPDGPSFSDLLDVINPLQHIPIINTLYQHLTGDKEGVVADVLGGALWGGVIGLGAAVANLLIEDNTGKSVGDHVYALFSDDDSPTAVAKGDEKTGQSAVAQNASPALQSPPNTMFDLSGANGTASPGQATQANEGPVVAGDFLVFGKAAGTVTPASTSGNGNTQTASAAVSTGSPTQSGDFLVFGTGPSAGGDAPVAPSTAVSGTSPQPLTPAGDAASPSIGTQTAALGAQPARSFTGPLRRTTAIPPQTLPMPTTGPAAVPGGARAASTTRSGTNQTDSAWFAGAFNEAMDKYNRASGLGTPAAAQGTKEGETANSVLQMN
ncbi:MAG TPA: hypothetical protein VN809_15565 [Telmatospirillum sp.]|nr:hypothetical protein [Telmatospirillum sp.]